MIGLEIGLEISNVGSLNLMLLDCILNKVNDIDRGKSKFKVYFQIFCNVCKTGKLEKPP